MSNRTIQNTQLKPNTAFYIRGNLSYARITSQLAGEALRKDDQRRIAHGMIPVEKPYTTATISHAEVIMANPQAPTAEEIYAQESLYTTKDATTGYNYSCNNKSKFLPWVAVRNADGTVQQINPESELASGLKVTLCMRIFAVRGRVNKGVTLDGIIVEEPIRYYNANSISAILANNGIVFIPNEEAEKARMNPPQTTTIDNNANTYNEHDTEIVNPYATQTPMPQATPFSNAPAGIRYNPNDSNINTGNRNY